MKILAGIILISVVEAFVAPTTETSGSKQPFEFPSRLPTGHVPSSLALNRCPRGGKSYFHSGLKASTEKSSETNASTGITPDEKQTLLSEINELTTAFEAVQSTIKSNTKLYQQRIIEYEEDIDALKVEINKQLEGVMNRGNDIKELKAGMDQSRTKIKVMQDEKDYLKNKETALLEEINVSKKKLKDEEKKWSSEKSSMLSKQETLSSMNTKLEGNIQTMQDELEELQSKEKELQGNIEDAKKKLKEEEIRWEKEKSEMMSVQSKLSERCEKLAQSELQLKENQNLWNEEKDTLLAEKKMIIEEKKSLQLEMSNALSKAEADQTKLERKIEELEDKLEVSDSGDTKLRTDVINLRAKSYKDLMDVRLEMDKSAEEAEEKINELANKLAEYEAERNSLRKLTKLGLKRFVSFFSLRSRQRNKNEGKN